MIALFAGAIALVVIVIAALMLAPDGDDPSGATDAPNSPSTPAATSTATATGAAASPTGTPQPSAPAEVPENWAAAASFSEAGKRYVVEDMTSWSGGLIAVGTRYEEEGRGVFGPPPPRAGLVWRSTDGTDWVDATPAGTFDDVELRILIASDAALIAIGDRWTGVERASAAWLSSDGETWEPLALDGVPDGAWVMQVASGAKGNVAATYLGSEAHALFSADGRSWEATLTDAQVVNVVAAGDDGFVATIFRGSGESTATIVASADGREWFDGVTPDDGAFVIAPRGGDWFASTTTFVDAISVATWQSANGLEWSSVGSMELGSVPAGDVSCSEAPAVIHGLPDMLVLGTILSGPCSEGAVIGAGASYASLDGADWTRLPFGDQAFAAAAAKVGDRVVVATDTRTSASPANTVTFWISEAP